MRKSTSPKISAAGAAIQTRNTWQDAGGLKEKSYSLIYSTEIYDRRKQLTSALFTRPWSTGSATIPGTHTFSTNTAHRWWTKIIHAIIYQPIDPPKYQVHDIKPCPQTEQPSFCQILPLKSVHSGTASVIFTHTPPWTRYSDRVRSHQKMAYISIERQMCLWPHLLDAFPTVGRGPRGRWPGLRRLSINIKRDGWKVLKKTDHHERYLIVCELSWMSEQPKWYGNIWTDLLAKTDPRTGVERDKNKWVVYNILLPIVEETIWVEFIGCWM